MAKTSCPITRSQFRAKAKPIAVTINNLPFQATVKEFSTGSLGWNVNGKTIIDIDGTPVSVQIGLNLTIVGSKELPQEPENTTPSSTPAQAGSERDGPT
jgi:hypothetical protein